MENQELSPSTITTAMTMIRSFYRYYQIQLPDPPRHQQDKRYDRVEDLPGHNDIRRAVLHSNIKYQAIILLMATSGMGRSEILNLTLGNLSETPIKKAGDMGETIQNIQKNGEPLRIDTIRLKSLKPYTTFTTIEAATHLFRYLQEEPPPKYDNDTKIFRGQHQKPLSKSAFTEYFRYLNRKCGWRKLGRQIYFRSHHLRKWFANTLEPEIGLLNTRRLMGHQILDTTEAAYFKVDTEHLRNLYKKNMDKLAILQDVQIIDTTDDRIQELEKKIEEQEEFINMIRMQEKTRMQEKIKK
jgi:integrase